MILQQPYWKTKPYFVRLDILNNDSRHKKYVGNNALIVTLIFCLSDDFQHCCFKARKIVGDDENCYSITLWQFDVPNELSTIKLELKGFYL